MSLDIGFGKTSVAIKLPSGTFLAVCRRAVAAVVDILTDKPLSFAQSCQCQCKHQLCKPCFLSLVILLERVIQWPRYDALKETHGAFLLA